MNDKSQPSSSSELEDVARTKLANSDPRSDLTTDLPSAGVTGMDTVRRVETSVEPRSPDGTVTYQPQSYADDPARTGLHTPSRHEGVSADQPVLAGYEILTELGRGGMGVVYKARHLGLSRVVALKMILGGAYANSEVVARFIAEARVVARFQHLNIVQVFDVGEVDGLPYFSLEFVEGGTLSQKIAREPQPPRYAAETIEQLARAMQYAHDRGIVHRDLKPANVLLAPDGTPKITDFGLAKTLGGDSGQTQSGQVLGTPSFMAPEQARGEIERVGPVADVYSLGAILYDLLTGRPPFVGSSVLDTLEMVRSREPIPPSELTGRLPRDLETICLKCLQKEPAKRYASAGDLADDLRRYLDNRPIVARPVGRVEKAWRWSKRNPVGALATVLGAALLIVPTILAVLLFDAKNFAQGKQKEAENALASEKRALVEKDAALDKAVQARDGLREQRAIALKVVRGVLIRVDEVMRYDRRLVPVRLQIIETMLEDLDKIRDFALKTPLEDRTEAAAFARIGVIYYDAGRIQDGYQWLSKAHPLLQANVDAMPEDLAELHNYAAIKNVTGDVEWRLGNGRRGRELYLEALKIRERMIPLHEHRIKRDEVKDPEKDLALNRALQNLADSYRLVAFSDLRLGDPDAAVDNYLVSDQRFTKLSFASHLPIRRTRAEIQVHLGHARLYQGKLDEAESHYRAALTEREKLLQDTPKPPSAVTAIKGDIALSRISLGDLLLMGRSNMEAAVAEYRHAFSLANELSKSEPDNLKYQWLLGAVHYRLGYAARQGSGFSGIVGRGKSDGHFEECRRLRDSLARIDPKDAQTQQELMLALARLGRVKEAKAIADAQLQARDFEPQVLFQCACGLAIAADTATDLKLAASCRDKAIDTLQRLVQKGWKASATLKLDPDLESLRDDPRFAKLTAALLPREK